MASARFKTNRRLWSVISTVLFLVPWFIPLIGKSGEMPMYVYPVGIFTAADTVAALSGTAVGILFFGVPALLGGWVVQCVVVMLMQRKENSDHAA